MGESDLEDIEPLLGHGIDPKRKGTIDDLYDLPHDLLEDLSKLHSLILRYRFLRYFTSADQWRWLPEFIDEVIEGRAELKRWRSGGILFPCFPTHVLITLDVSKILSVLQPRLDESWRQFAPDREAWRIGEAVTGAPAVQRAELRYDWEPPTNVRRVAANSTDRLLYVEDIAVATRRWIASRVVGRAEEFGAIERFDTPEALLKEAFHTDQNPSSDAAIAIRGAMQEAKVLGRSEVEVPGFRGPPDWYR
jgi:hypothetical protein